MERITPQEKKRLNYEKQRRYGYGNNQKAARTSVPRNKRNNNRSLRKNANQLLQPGSLAELNATDEALDTSKRYNVKRWRKQPDFQLKYYIIGKRRDRGLPRPDEHTVFGRLKVKEWPTHY